MVRVKVAALIECVPNFSEGRRSEVIQAIVQSVADVMGVLLLDVSSDPDHNRTVITFAGTPDIVAEAAFQSVKTASQLIDLDDQIGQHPRIGATDVLPFVPLRDSSLAECVSVAHQVGQRIADEIDIPVYYYEAAALRPERKNLAYVRRHQYERLKETIGSDPDRTPDLGPHCLGPAGAVVIGARFPLIAFNAFLDTNDVKIAKAIAKAVRQSGGGLPAVKALGLLVHGKAQVSMNIIDYRVTSLFQVVEAVEYQAGLLGTSVTHTELVGLVPQAALIQSAVNALKLPRATEAFTIEKKLGSVTGNYREID